MKKSLVMMVMGLTLGATSLCMAESPSHHEKAAIAGEVVQTNPVNINTADLATLETLKGLGPHKAQAIIDYRTAKGPFVSVDDLSHVKGIGAKMLLRLQHKNPDRIVLK